VRNRLKGRRRLKGQTIAKIKDTACNELVLITEAGDKFVIFADVVGNLPMLYLSRKVKFE